jgi:hypothetical protein
MELGIRLYLLKTPILSITKEIGFSGVYLLKSWLLIKNLI